MKSAWFRKILGWFVVVFSCVFCVFVGFFIGVLFSPVENDEDIDWVPLGKPSTPISDLLFVNPYAVFVTTTTGQIYAREVDCASEFCWTVLDSLELSDEDWISESLVIADTCKTTNTIKPPPGTIVECASLTNLGMAGGYLTAYYVLLDDGAVWLWIDGDYDIDYGLMLVSALYYGLIGAGISLVLYTFFGLIYFFLVKSILRNKLG